MIFIILTILAIKFLIIYSFGKIFLLLFVPVLFSTVYFIISLLSVVNFGSEAFLITLFVEILQIMYLFLMCMIVVRHKSMLKKLYLNTSNKMSRNGYKFLTVSIVIAVSAYLIDPNFLLDPRETHKDLMKDSLNGGYLYTFISPLIAVMSILTLNLTIVFSVGILGFLTGSKGLFINSFVYFILYRYVNYGINIKLFFAIITALSFIAYYIDYTIRGVDNALYYLIYSYFDYAQNMSSIANTITLLPTEHSIFLINEFIPGWARLSGASRTLFSLEFFPYETSLNKNPGLLYFENLFRTGLIGYLLYLGAKLFLFYVLFNIAIKEKSFVLCLLSGPFGSVKMFILIYVIIWLMRLPHRIKGKSYA